MNEHSPEPWRVRENIGDCLVVVDANGRDTTILADLNNDPSVGLPGDPEGAQADIRRIIACVNACAGITTEALEQYKGVGIFSMYSKAVAENRELRLKAGAAT